MDERAGQRAPSKGGGPPGGSAFDRLGRLRRQSSRQVFATDDAFAAVEPIAEPPPQPPSTPRSPDPDSPRATGPRSFPGGRVTLPRLDGKDGTSVHLTGAAFRPDTATTREAEHAGSTFTEYFTAQSLFSDASSSSVDEGTGPPAAVIAAYTELRLPPDSSWPEVLARHRALVKEFHPDRFGDHDAAARERAEAEIRRINNAYDTIRRYRPDMTG